MYILSSHRCWHTNGLVAILMGFVGQNTMVSKAVANVTNVKQFNLLKVTRNLKEGMWLNAAAVGYIMPENKKTLQRKAFLQ